MVDAAGTVVRTLRSDVALAPGTYSLKWNGRNEAGAYVPRGTYRSQVRATNGVQAATQHAAVLANAFRILPSDSTPARRQRITVTVVTPEALAANPRVAIYQPGIDRWSVATTKVSSTKYKVTFTLRSSKTGTVRIKAYGKDTGGRSQNASIYLPLH